MKERYIYGTEMLAVMKGENSGESVPDLEYMLKDHLGNVRVMLGENHTKYPSTLDIKSYNNNYAFGAPHPFRNFNLLDQRHAFNGQEKPNEIKGVGLHYSFKAREYDPVYGRFWSIDPYNYGFPNQSSYVISGNSPIASYDMEGKFQVVVAESAKNYGLSALVLQNFISVANNISKLVDANPRILNEMMRQTGKSREELLGWLQPNQGEEIRICVGCTGYDGARGGNTGIDFEASLVDDMGSYTVESELYEANLLVIAMTILHEATHRGDALTNGMTTTGTGSDLGAQNSTSEVGHRGIDVEKQVIGFTTSSAQTSDGKFFTPRSELENIRDRLKHQNGLYGSFFISVREEANYRQDQNVSTPKTPARPQERSSQGSQGGVILNRGDGRD